MKLLSGWFDGARGFALGALVGCLAIGSAIPHLVAAIGGVTGHNWHLVMRASTVQAIIAGALILLFVREGPYAEASAPFDFRQVGEVLRNRQLRLATFGYLGHMWELYSLWTWIAVILAAALSADARTALVRGIAFAVMSVGVVGCVGAGIAADGAEKTHLVRSRSRVTIIAMATSGVCCLLLAACFSSPKLVLLIAMVWGASVVADSAQFSAIVSEVADKRYIGTALTVQTALGFLLTVVAIRVTGVIAMHYGWRLAVATLAVGPILGTVAMAILQRADSPPSGP
jgi:MFS family permease